MHRPFWTGLSATVMAVLTAAPAFAEGQAPEIDSGTKIRVFDHFVLKGGLITWVILIPMSIAMVALVIEHAIKIRRTRILPPDLIQRIRDLFSQKRFRDVLELTNNEPSDLSFIIHSALNQASSGYAAMERAAEEAIEQRNARLTRKIELLNTIGNVSPMVGLFGTVFGMIVAFQTLVESGGQPDPSKLANGISVALVTTFWGLLVGIPALTAFAVFRNRVDGLTAECAMTVDDLMSVFKPAASRPPAATQLHQQPAPSPVPRPGPFPQPPLQQK